MAKRIILGLISSFAALASLYAAYAVVYFHWDAGNPHTPAEIQTARWGYHIWACIFFMCVLVFGACFFFFIRTFGQPPSSENARPFMRRRILGFCSTLTFLYAGYATAWFSDPNEISDFVAGKPDLVIQALEALTLASIFTLVVLFLIVWPQTLLANWMLRRFQLNRFFPFALFFVVSSIAAGILDCLAVDSHRLMAYLVGTGYLVLSCSILWWISFKDEPVADSYSQPAATLSAHREAG